MQKIDLSEYWIGKDGHLIKYEEMDEKYAINLLVFLDNQKIEPNPKLIERIEYLTTRNKKIKKLF